VTAQATTTAAGPVQGPAAPTHTDLIWATASSQAALDDPHATTETRQAVLEAEAATYTAAAYLGVDEATAGEYAAGLAALDQAAQAMEAPGDCVSLAEWSAAVAQCPEPEAGL
jgi:hypothetical protein